MEDRVVIVWKTLFFSHRFYSFGKEKGVLAKRNLRLLRDDDMGVG